MPDFYLKSKDREVLLAFATPYKNFIVVQQGREGTPQTLDDDGNTIPERPGAGDPAYWYTCVRTDQEILPWVSGIELCDPEEGKEVCGIWA